MNCASEVEVIHPFGNVLRDAEASVPVESAMHVEQHVLKRSSHQLGDEKSAALFIDSGSVES